MPHKRAGHRPIYIYQTWLPGLIWEYILSQCCYELSDIIDCVVRMAYLGWWNRYFSSTIFSWFVHSSAYGMTTINIHYFENQNFLKLWLVCNLHIYSTKKVPGHSHIVWLWHNYEIYIMQIWHSDWLMFLLDNAGCMHVKYEACTYHSYPAITKFVSVQELFGWV